MPDAPITLAAVQMTSGSDVERNLDDAERLVDLAADQGATYVQLPEYCSYYGPARGFDGAAEKIPGPITRRFSELAKRRGIAVHLGSIVERSATPGEFHNTSVLIDDTGDVVATYRKAHLFDVDVPGQIVYRESDAIAAGHQLVTADLGGFRLGMSICFDVRFPEMYRQLALGGANVLAVPAAFSAATGRSHWEVLLRARAIENHAYLVSAAQVGTTAEGLATWGHSMIIDPWGDVLAESSAPGADVVVVTIDLGEVERRRSQIAVLELRRPELYGSN